MTNRMEVLTELADLCRVHPFVALGTISYAAGAMDLDGLQRLLMHARELRDEWVPGSGYLALVDERYGAGQPLA